MRVFLSYAFRPFFLLNAVFALLAMGLWLLTLHGISFSAMPANIIDWHAHEMLVGFAMAAIAGFILTAVATWTGRPPVQGVSLALLVFAWLSGRLAMLLSGWLPATWVMLIDMSFPVLLIILIAREVIGAGNSRNYPIVLIAFLLALFNFLFHSANTGWLPLQLAGSGWLFTC